MHQFFFASLQWTMSSISDIYFFCELQRFIGPKQSNHWLESCVQKKEQYAATSCTKLPSSCSKLDSVALANTDLTVSGLEISEKKEGGIHSTKTVEGNENQCFETILNGTYCDYEELNSIPSDQCSNADSPTNLGLLFTDAAHIVLSERSTSRSAKRICRYSTSFF